MNPRFAIWAALCGVAVPGAALAQLPVYRSAWTDYRAFTADQPALDWRDANDALRELGHGSGMTMQGGSHAPPAPGAKAPDLPPKPRPATPAAKADPPGHAGHAGHAAGKSR